ncbi:MAG: hypothetical protein V1918_09445 [Planctomycetota bacterium]
MLSGRLRAEAQGGRPDPVDSAGWVMTLCPEVVIVRPHVVAR